MNATNLRQTDIIRMRREYGGSRKTECSSRTRSIKI